MGSYSFPLLSVATGSFLQLKASLASKSRLEILLARLGWQASIEPGDIAAVNTVFGLSGIFTQLEGLIQELRYQRGDVVAVAEAIFTTLSSLYEAVDELGTSPPTTSLAPFNETGFWPAIATDLVPLLLANELRRTSPLTYGVLFLIGVIEETHTIPTSPGRIPYTRITLQWDALGDFFSNPTGTLAQRYGWGSTNTLDYQRLLRELYTLTSSFQLAPRLSAVPAPIGDAYYSDAELELRRINSLIIPFINGFLPDGSGAIEFGLSLTPIPAVALSGQAPAGLLLAPYLHGAYQGAVSLRSDLLLEFIGAFSTDNGFAAEVLPDVVHFRNNLGSPGTSFGAELRLTSTPAAPLRFFGSDTSSRVELTGYAFGVGITGTSAQPELVLRVGTGLPGADTGRLTLYVATKEGDSFLGKAFGPDPIKIELSGFVTWSSRTGLGIDGVAGLHLRRTPNKTIGPLTLHNYTLDVNSQVGTPVTAAVGFGASLKLGPITATVEQVGLAFKLTNTGTGSKGLLDNLDVEWGFRSPTGIGLKVESDALSGGGYLFIDKVNHKYAGVAQLAFKDKINLTAFGLLQTELPGNPDAYSLLLLITAQFNPVQLGMGFTLKGIGGLVGINRTADTDFLRGLVRNGRVRELLFPANVLDNAAATLALVDAAFPATDGRYVIGLMAQIGWGAPVTLITLDVALLVELPLPGRLAILGVLEAVLPSQSTQLLKLRADFLGTIDFASKRAAFDATLSDSRVLQFILTGDLAFRLYQGHNPLFVITAGGFHPAFQPPAGAALTGLRRLTLALATGDDLRITLTNYFAVTSNTVQFGSRLTLYLRLTLGFHVEGYFGFDVLFQFNPFRVLAHMEAGVAVKRGSTEWLSLHLSLDVTGPGPWHIWGEASFRALGCKISVDVSATIGPGAAPVLLPAPNVYNLVRAALTATTSWEVEAPTTALAAGVVLRPVNSQAGQLFLAPRGALVLRQRVVPLGLPIEKYGSGTAAPTGGSLFNLTALQVGTIIMSTTGSQATRPEVVSDFFAPEQFRRLTDAEKLSSPSFQLLPSGLRARLLAGLVGASTATRRVVEYEQLLLEGPTTGGRAGSGEATDPGSPLGARTTTRQSVVISTTAFQKLARNGALGQAYASEQPSARAPQPVRWQEEAYAVVNAADLSVYDSANHPSFASQVQAEAYRRSQTGMEALLVVPSYQLINS